MRLLAAAAFAFALTALATPASAQNWGMQQPVGATYSDLGIQGSSTETYWTRCSSANAANARTTLSACQRLIGARLSRMHTASALFFSAKVYATLGDAALSQRTYERAYSLFNAAFDANGDDAAALYGRGITAIKLGRQAEGEADIARAQTLDGDRLSYYIDAGLR